MLPLLFRFGKPEKRRCAASHRAGLPLSGVRSNQIAR
jgi:hypothetical protein